MRSRTRRPRRRAVILLAVVTAAALAACTPGGDSGDSDSSSGPVTLKLQANAVKGGKNANEASWLQDYAIPAF
jgi:multiple sugar transport system substrate-binding protein